MRRSFEATFRQTQHGVQKQLHLWRQYGAIDGFVYTVFEVLNSRGLDVDWLDKTKSMLMGRAYELAASPAAAEAEIQSLQNFWGEIYRELAKEDISGDEILRVPAPLFSS